MFIETQNPQGDQFKWEHGGSKNIPSGGIDGPDNLLANSSFSRKTDVEVVESALRCILTSIAYISMPISSGKRLYDVFTKFNVKSKEELDAIDPQILFKEVIAPNAESGKAFAKEVQERSKLPILLPGIFESKGERWREEEYMALWLRVLEGKAKEIHLIQNWEYSNGSVEEFVRGAEIQSGLSKIEDNSDMKIFDHTGNETTVEHGIDMIRSSIKDLKGRGFNVPRLEVGLRKLECIKNMFGQSDTTTQT